MTVEERLELIELRLQALEALFVDGNEVSELEEQHQNFAVEIKRGKARASSEPRLG